MKPLELLKQQLQHIDGKDYGAYQSLKGQWAFSYFELFIDRIPKDPYAPPSTGVYRARVPRDKADFSGDVIKSRTRTIAFRDYLARQFNLSCSIYNRGRRGTGNSGIIAISEPGQVILDRTSIVIDKNCIEARFFMGLPAKGRSINARIAESMFFEELPQIIESSLYAKNLDLDALDRHIKVAEDAEYLRDSLCAAGLVAFIRDGAILPRESGVEQKPLDTSSVVPFKSPDSLRVSFDLPNAGIITGMGIPKGVILIVGGGYHGKSTILQALELGVYNHIPGDGRDYCVSAPETVKVRTASGRSVVKTDISAFINNIPLRETPTAFSTTNASGSTSQAAFVAESIEAVAKVLLMDEDTCAMNFIIRDKRMQELVSKKHEPITSFVDKVRQLYEEHDISTILVMGGSGDYFSVADCIIQMIAFEPYNVTERAHTIAECFPTNRAQEGGPTFKSPIRRFPLEQGLNPYNEYGNLRITAQDPRRLIFGQNTVDLSELAQIVETAQTKAIGRAILYAKHNMDGERELIQIIIDVMEDIQHQGLDVLDNSLTGDLAQFRGLELAATLNRMRNLMVNQRKKSSLCMVND
ncbi:MAG: ABC-ATPase domain-containing protein [Candidatus Hatepunaea meridiana]|nr:ABC-ATPase domain-containing protein [Candidatus Hatepunaea meridiana]